jgi:5-amino-6-(5-phosphoribosylamino)uracil reductase
MASDFGERAPRSAILRRVRELLREHDELGAPAHGDASSSSSSMGVGPADVGAHVREHRLDSDAERPYVAANVIVSDDGRPALHAYEPARLGAAGAVGVALRDEVDALLVGAGALRSGRVERPLADPGRRARRRDHGLTLDPIAIMIARSECDVSPLAHAADATAPILLYTSAPDPLSAPHGVELTRMASSDLRPSAVLAHARREHGARTVLYEGGTQMLAVLLADGALDELLLTIAPEIEPDPQQPPINELPGFSELAADRMWETDTGPTVLRLHPEPRPAAR